jgi:hypothetical protein
MSTDLLDHAEVVGTSAAAQTASQTTALSLPQRAAVALQSSSYEATIRNMIEDAKTITEVKNLDGRTQCHAKYMTFKKTRTSIAAAAKTAREDATAFSKAVIEEEKRLTTLISEEETRLLALRDAWDKAEEEKRIERERLEALRMASIKARIHAVRDLQTGTIGKTSEQLQAMLNSISGDPEFETYEEFAIEFKGVLEATQSLLTTAIDAAKKAEAEAQRVAAEQASMEAERKEMAAKMAELKAQIAQAEADKAKAEREAKAAQHALVAQQAQAEADAAAVIAAQATPAFVENPSSTVLHDIPSAKANAPEYAYGDVLERSVFADAIAMNHPEGVEFKTADVDDILKVGATEFPVKVAGAASAPLRFANTGTTQRRPSAQELVNVIALQYNVKEATARNWLATTEFLQEVV